MKYIFIALLLFSCIDPSEEHHIEPASSLKVPGEIYITTIDSCQYIIWNNPSGYAGMGGITHKGNCPNH